MELLYVIRLHNGTTCFFLPLLLLLLLLLLNKFCSGIFHKIEDCEKGVILHSGKHGTLSFQESAILESLP